MKKTLKQIVYTVEQCLECGKKLKNVCCLLINKQDLTKDYLNENPTICNEEMEFCSRKCAIKFFEKNVEIGKEER